MRSEQVAITRHKSVAFYCAITAPVILGYGVESLHLFYVPAMPLFCKILTTTRRFSA